MVDDYEPFRQFVCRTLREKSRHVVIGQACDGQEAVQKATELQPDLVLLDIGLPKLNGITAARRIHESSPACRILFISQESDTDIVRDALDLGVSGYVLKTDLSREMLIAVDTSLRGERFVSSALASKECLRAADLEAELPPSSEDSAPILREEQPFNLFRNPSFKLT